jgi:3-oxoadipate enol-lactonase
MSHARQRWCPRYSGQVWQGPVPGHLGWSHLATIDEEDHADFRLRNKAYIRGSIVETARLIDNAGIGDIDDFPKNQTQRNQERRMDFIELDGAALRYELSGNGGRTLVLVHEMGGSLESWDDVARQFPDSRQVLRYDSRGAGMSQKVRGELAIDTMAEDIAALLDHIGIAGKVALAGIAVGGAIALHFAARYPERTSGVVVGSPATGIAPDRRAAVLERVAKIEAAGMAFAVEDSMNNGYPTELRGDIKRFERYRARWLGNDPSSYATVYRMLAATDIEDELTRLRCPVLVIGGSLDRTRPPQLAKALASAIPSARYVEARTGHYMAVQTPDLIFDCVDEFLRTVSA